MVSDSSTKISNHDIDVDVEGRAEWITFSRRGALDENGHKAFLQEVLPLARAMTSLGTNGAH